MESESLAIKLDRFCVKFIFRELKVTGETFFKCGEPRPTSKYGPACYINWLISNRPM